MGLSVWSLICYALIRVLSRFANILMSKRELCFKLFLMSCDSKWSVAIPNSAVSGLQFVVVVIVDHTNFLFK